MNNLLKVFALFFVLSFNLAWAKGGQSRMTDTAYITGLIGSAIQAESETAPVSVKDDQNPEASTAGSLAIGYKWEHFAMEFVYANFGATTNDIADKYTEEHKAFFFGAGLHWMWGWFDLKFGWGTGNDKVSYKQGAGSTTFSADPNGESSGGRGGYFGIGLNFDLGARTEFIIDYTGYAWSQKDLQTISVDGDTLDSEDYMTKMATFSIGLRRFF